MANHESVSVNLYGRVFIRGDIKAVTGLHIGGAAGALEIGGGIMAAGWEIGKGGAATLNPWMIGGSAVMLAVGTVTMVYGCDYTCDQGNPTPRLPPLGHVAGFDVVDPDLDPVDHPPTEIYYRGVRIPSVPGIANPFEAHLSQADFDFLVEDAIELAAVSADAWARWDAYEITASERDHAIIETMRIQGIALRDRLGAARADAFARDVEPWGDAAIEHFDLEHLPN